MKELTVIITFLNENVEVERTLASLKKHTNSDIDIILVNDHSYTILKIKCIIILCNTFIIIIIIRMVIY